MRLTILTSDGSTVSVADFEAASLVDFLDAWRDMTQSVIQINLDDDGIAYLARHHIVRVDIE